MDDIQKRDQTLLREELRRVGPLFSAFGLSVVSSGIAVAIAKIGNWGAGAAIALTVAIVAFFSWQHYREAKRRAEQRWFSYAHLRTYWNSCKERLKLLHEASRELKSAQSIDLSEMPTTVERVSNNLYSALRRADMVLMELAKSEGPMLQRILQGQVPTGSIAENRAAQDLYRLADKNVAEYRQNYAGVLRGVQITEAQAAVFITTLDSLRLKILGYRLAGKSPEVPRDDFLQTLGEAKAQLESIDKALDEIEINPFSLDTPVTPGMLIPPPMPGSFESELARRVEELES